MLFLFCKFEIVSILLKTQNAITMPVYNRDLNCWISTNPGAFVTSDEDYDDEYEIDYPTDSEEEGSEEEEDFGYEYFLRGEKEIQKIWDELPGREAASTVIQRWWRRIH